MQLSNIYIYPIKGMGAISLKQASLAERGLLYDRRWMLVDANGRFITQRQQPILSQLELEIQGAEMRIRLRNENERAIQVALQPTHGTEIQVQIWNDRCIAWKVDPQADAWCSAILGQPCHLVYMPDSSHRMADPQYAKGGEIVSFADGYPTLIIGQASLDLLNQKLKSPIEMLRFRPNLVFEGGEAHAEDQWEEFHIGSIPFQGVKLCARCSVPTIDLNTGQPGKEPTATLSTYRAWDRQVWFGLNLLHPSKGVIRVGDPVEVRKLVERRADRQVQ